MLSKRVARPRRVALIGFVGALAVSMSACASQRDTGGSAGDTFVFGATSMPKNFDPVFNDDGESFRPARQMYETLIRYKAGTTEPEADLATSWTPSADAKSWAFTLRQGVKFHDGTPFNAAAVCFNFDRWYNIKGAAAQRQMIYYGDVFEGFAHNEGDTKDQSVYKSCEAKDEYTAVINLNRAKGAFPDAFGLTSLSISSPTALQKYNADTVTQTGQSFTYSDYANLHPTGTGPFKFDSFDKNNNVVTLVRNDDYWGGKAKLTKLIFKAIPDENARKQELAAGTIDGYDYPRPADFNSLTGAGEQVLMRPAFNILYLGINQKGNPKLQDVRVREAIEHAINRQQLVRNKFPDGAYAQDQFLPNNVAGYTDAVAKFDYDPAKAKQLLTEADATNLSLNFYVPTETTRPYLPDPVGIGAAITEDLKAAGITVNVVPEPFNGGFMDDVQNFGKQDIHLLGWNGDYADAGNFIGTFFGRPKPEFGFDDPQIFSALSNADTQVTADAKKNAYQQASVLISQYVPAVPIVSGPPAIVVAKNIHGLIPSPLTDERFYTVSKS